MLHGHCHCGAVQFDVPEQAAHSAICKCQDCRHQSGAPIVAWAMYPAEKVQIQGELKIYQSSAEGRRSFCGHCGTGLFFTNEVLRRMGMLQVRIAALEQPDAVPPVMQVQVAEQIRWMSSVHARPRIERFPR